MSWRKSSRSGSSGGDCVEVAFVPAGVGVRDSKNPCGGVLSVEPEQWRAFVRMSVSFKTRRAERA